MTYAQVLAALRKHKGEFHLWNPRRGLPDEAGLVRHKTLTDKDGRAMCPLSVLRHDRGIPDVSNCHPTAAMIDLALDYPTYRRVVDAADYQLHPDKPALLEACCD